MYPTNAIQELLDRIRSGDNVAGGELVALTYDRVKALVQRVLRIEFDSLRRHAQTTDLLHEVEAKLVRYVDQGLKRTPETPRHFFALVKTITRNTCLDLVDYFRQTTRQAGEFTAEPRAIDALVGPSTAVGMMAAIEQLSEDEQELYYLLLQGFTGAEIATMHGVDPGTVSRRRTALIRKFQRLLGVETHA